VFAALAALGAGLEVAVRQVGTHDALGPGYAVAVPAAAFLALLWVSHSPIVPRSPVRPSVLFGAAGLVLLAPMVGAGTGAVVALVALVATAAVVVTVVLMRTSRPGGLPPHAVPAGEGGPPSRYDKQP
jgi:hypothetical protein